MNNLNNNFRTSRTLGMQCGKCGAVAEGGHIFCPMCGEELRRSCPKCKTVLTYELFCPMCGTEAKQKEDKIPEPTLPVDISARKGVDANTKLKFLVGALSGFLITVLLAMIFWNSGIGKSEFEEKFPDIVHNSWCELNDSGDEMIISGEGGYYYSDKALDAVYEINKELGIPYSYIECIERVKGEFENSKYYFSWESSGDYYLDYKFVYRIK